MKTLVVQRGHVPRKTGSTGAPGEQALARRNAAAIVDLMARVDGWQVRVIDADEPTSRYAGDAFVALHGDGSSSPSASGASVGYRTDEGRAVAHRWKVAYAAAGWTGAFRGDNYTGALSGYYGHRRAVEAGNRAAVIVEHGFLTNPAERAWCESAEGVRAAALAAVYAATKVDLSGEVGVEIAAGGRGGTMLRRGSRGTAVRDWQLGLLRWKPGILPRFGADSDFGGETEAATKTLQGAAGIAADGIVGPQTRGALTRLSEPAVPTSQVVADDAKLAVLLREAPLEVRGGVWTPVPMDTFHGGDESLYAGGYITGAPGYWLHAAYLRFGTQADGQAMVRFVRDIGGEHDFTGTVDWNFTPGKDYKSHVWPFDPRNGKPTGFEVWSSETVTLEYAQLKAARIQ